MRGKKGALIGGGGVASFCIVFDRLRGAALKKGAAGSGSADYRRWLRGRSLTCLGMQGAETSPRYISPADETPGG